MLTAGKHTLVTGKGAQVGTAGVMAEEGAGLTMTQGQRSASARQARQSPAQQAGRPPSTRCPELTRWSKSWPTTSAASRRL